MANRLVVAENPRHEYLVTALLADTQVDLLIDTGFTSPQCRTGVGLDAVTFQRLRQQLGPMRPSLVSGMAASPSTMPTGSGVVSLLGLDDSSVETRVVDVGVNVLGVCYFHRLPGYRLTWDLRARTITIEPRS